MHQEVSPTFFQATISQQLEKEHKKNNQISEECSCFVIINQILDLDRDLHNCILVINKTKTFFGPHDNFGVMFINQKNTDNTNNSAKKNTQKTRNAKKKHTHNGLPERRVRVYNKHGSVLYLVISNQLEHCAFQNYLTAQKKLVTNCDLNSKINLHLLS